MTTRFPTEFPDHVLFWDRIGGKEHESVLQHLHETSPVVEMSLSESAHIAISKTEDINTHEIREGIYTPVVPCILTTTMQPKIQPEKPKRRIGRPHGEKKTLSAARLGLANILEQADGITSGHRVRKAPKWIESDTNHYPAKKNNRVTRAALRDLGIGDKYWEAFKAPPYAPRDHIYLLSQNQYLGSHVSNDKAIEAAPFFERGQGPQLPVVASVDDQYNAPGIFHRFGGYWTATGMSCVPCPVCCVLCAVCCVPCPFSCVPMKCNVNVSALTLFTHVHHIHHTSYIILKSLYYFYARVYTGALRRPSTNDWKKNE